MIRLSGETLIRKMGEYRWDGLVSLMGTLDVMLESKQNLMLLVKTMCLTSPNFDGSSTVSVLQRGERAEANSNKRVG